MKGVAGIFAYSKTKGLFAGVSLEGSAIVERKDANEKMYNRKVSAAQLLGGSVPAPVEAEALMRVLNSRSFSGNMATTNESIYNDAPVYGDEHEDVGWNNRRSEASSQPPRSATWQDDLYDRDSPQGGVNRSYTSRDDGVHGISGMRSPVTKPKPPPPIAPKPKFGAAKGGPDQAVAKFTFEGEQDGALSFKKGDIITILKRTDNETDWWTGRIGNKEGIFPR